MSTSPAVEDTRYRVHIAMTSTMANPRPITAVGCCSHCGGATWQHEAHDICGRCGHITQHEVSEIRR